MTNKDWILLLAPIISNLMINGLITKVLFDRYINRRLLRSKTVGIFLEKLKDIKNALLELNINSMRGKDVIDVRPIQDLVIDVVKYYHTNNYDLKQFKRKYAAFDKKWMSFQEKYCEVASKKEKNVSAMSELGLKMQNFSNSLDELIKIVSKRY